MMFFGVFIGVILQVTHGNYTPVFWLAGMAYLVAIALIHTLAPSLGSRECWLEGRVGWLTETRWRKANRFST
jgi:hypothetical protein